MMSTRIDHLNHFYDAIQKLENINGGSSTLAETISARRLPLRGVYFFFEPGETRAESGIGNRIIRVGTHALKQGSRSTLRQRLSQHMGSKNSGRGNHRGSIFRLLIGDAIQSKYPTLRTETWGKGNNATPQIRIQEAQMEETVSKVAGNMRVICLEVVDQPGPQSLRAYIEKNSIALLSNYSCSSLDSPSTEWLGRNSSREKVRHSGLWNNNHVDESYDPNFLEILDDLVERRN